MSQTHMRMSPVTALFVGLFGVAAVAVASVTTTVIYGMSVLDGKVGALIGLAENTVASLPEIVEALPPVLGDVLRDRRAPEYADRLHVKVQFVANERSQSVRPVLTVTNEGDEVVSMLAVRVVGFGEGKRPLRDWTALAATPIALEDELPGPLLPGSKRHLFLDSSRSLYGQLSDDEAAIEVSDIRLWTPEKPGEPL